jgi:hypothetical protein
MSSDKLNRSLSQITDTITEHSEACRRLTLARHYYSEAKTHMMMVESYLKDSRTSLQNVVDIGLVDDLVFENDKAKNELECPTSVCFNLKENCEEAKRILEYIPSYTFTGRLDDLTTRLQTTAQSLLELKLFTQDAIADEKSESESEASEESEESDESEPVLMTEKVIQRRIHPKNRTHLFLTCMNPYQGYIKVGRGTPLGLTPGYYRLDMNHTQMSFLKTSVDESANSLILNGYAKKMSGRIFYNREKNAVDVEVSPSGNYYY